MAGTGIDLCLIDCSSIQKYVFGSNKLKTNIGASQLVVDIYEFWISIILEKLFKVKTQFDFMNWEKEPDTIPILEPGSSLLMETGYIGGGNALLLFKANQKTDYANEFVRLWTTELLQIAPGIRPVVAVEKNVHDLSAGIEEVFKTLQTNKSRFLPDTALPRHGITAACRISGLSTEIEHPDEKGQWISSVTRTKLNYVKRANDELAKTYKSVLKDDLKPNDFKFGEELENLGQEIGAENHVAIIHIDGNRMGQEFKNLPDLRDKRNLSIEINKRVRQTMAQTLEKLIKKIPDLVNEKVLTIPFAKDKKTRILPVRPMILNGDDITFICEARISFFLTEVFLREFSAIPVKLEKADGTKQNIPVSACAGISIVKTKYPFYRAYELAEQLCQNAKKKWRENSRIKDYSGCWLDFHISQSGMSGSLNDIREQKYQIGKKSLLWRPWEINGYDNEHDFNNLKDALKILIGKSNQDEGWPRSKINQFAEVLNRGKASTLYFLKMMAARNLQQPTPEDWSNITDGWEGEQTPYFDVLEIIDFYPACLMD